MAVTGCLRRLYKKNCELLAMAPIFTLLFFYGCNGGPGAQIQMSSQLPAAKPYYHELETKTRYATVFQQLQRVVAVYAVPFDPGFSQAYTQFVSQYTQPGGATLFTLPNPGKIQILVSVFAPTARDMDLDNGQLWALSASATQGQDPVAAERVVRMKEKKRLCQEFPFVSPWSQEFLITIPMENMAQLHLKSPAVILSLNW